MTRLELNVTQTSSGSAISDAAKAAENLRTAEQRLAEQRAKQEAAARKVQIAQERLNKVKASGKDDSLALMRAEDNLASAVSRLNRETGRTELAVGKLSEAQRTAGQAAKTADGNIRKLGDGATSAGGGLGSFLGAAGKMAGALGLVSLAKDAGQKLLELGKESVTAASDLQQSSGAAAAVFGGAYAKISDAARTSAKDVGLSSSAYQQMAATLGAGLKNQGIEDFAGSTQKVIGLGADLAAQFGGDTASAVEAIGSLMRGEADPIERYGVTIKQSAVSAKLAEQGLGGLEGAAKTQAEAQARLALLFEQTGQAQGTFSRESDTLAGAQARVAAQTEDLKAKVGSALLPAVTAVTQAIGGAMDGSNLLGQAFRVVGDIISAYVTPIIARIKDGFGQLKDAVDKATGGSDKTRDMMEKVGAVIGKVAGVMGGIVSLQIQALISSLVQIVKTAGDVARWVETMGDKLGDIKLPGSLGAIRDVLGSIVDKAKAAADWVGRITAPGGITAAISGLFRAEWMPTVGDTGASYLPLLVPAPVTHVSVQVDGAALRGVVRSEIRAVLRGGSDVR